MTVKKVLLYAAELAGRSDLGEKLEAGEKDGELDLLLKCYNLVENEVALDYFPLKKRELFVPESGKILFARFAEAPVEVLSVRDCAGGTLEFEVFPEAISLLSAREEVAVTYAYAPKEKQADGVSEYAGKVSFRLLAFGTATEFLLAHGLYAEAAASEKRYREALRAANCVRRRLSIRARRWE